MNEYEEQALDKYLTTPLYEELSETYDDKPMNVDDNGTEIDKNDWVFIAYFLENKYEGEHTSSESHNKYVLEQNGFMDLLKKEGVARLDTRKLKIISGEDWLKLYE